MTSRLQSTGSKAVQRSPERSASHLGAELDINSLPISSYLKEEVGEELAYRFALSDSDDYELCFTIPKRLEDEIKRLDLYKRTTDMRTNKNYPSSPGRLLVLFSC